MTAVTFPKLGLTVTQFIDTLSDKELRIIVGDHFISILDAIFGGEISTENLKKASIILLDIKAQLTNPETRKNLLALIPNSKIAEFENRTEKSISSSDSWSESDIEKALDFFGIIEERLLPYPRASVENILPEYALFEHQRTAAQKLTSILREDRRRAILHLPTGAGKTRTAMHVVCEYLRDNDPSIVVWLASGKELLEQAVMAFKEAWRHLGNRSVEVGSLWGSSSLEISKFSDGFLAIGLHKGWSLFKTNSDWTIELSPRVRLVVFDEAHQSVARTYSKISNELTLHPKCSLLGLTATPGRTWKDIDQDGKLSEFYFSNKVTLETEAENPIEFLINNNYIAKPEFRTLLSEPGDTLSEEDKARISTELEIPEYIIHNLTLSKQYIVAVIQSIESLIAKNHMKIIVFSASVSQAKFIAVILASRDIECSVVTADTPSRLRDQAIRNFKSKDSTPRVLVNFGVLTTGFDAPKASAAVIARPTKSLVLFSQMVGRVLRGTRAGGTNKCEIVTVIDPALPGFGDIVEAFNNWEDIW